MLFSLSRLGWGCSLDSHLLVPCVATLSFQGSTRVSPFLMRWIRHLFSMLTCDIAFLAKLDSKHLESKDCPYIPNTYGSIWHVVHMLKYLSISYQMNPLNKRHYPVPTKTSEWLSLEDDPPCARRTQIPARRSLEKYIGERTRVWGGTKHRILRMTLNRKPASQDGNRDWVHGTVSFTPSSTWCHSHCPVELCVKGLGPQGFSISNLCRSMAEPGLGAGGVPRW